MQEQATFTPSEAIADIVRLCKEAEIQEPIIAPCMAGWELSWYFTGSTLTVRAIVTHTPTREDCHAIKIDLIRLFRIQTKGTL